MATDALRDGRLVQIVRGDHEAAGIVMLPILAGERPHGILGIDLADGVPLDPWSEELFWAAADLMALVMVGRDSRRGPPGEPRLTRRQRDVLFELVEHGATNAQIATTLGVSARTVKIHLMAAYRQLGVQRRGEAIRLVLTRHADWLSQERKRRRGRCTG
jgi:DNA-binding CsgD family transcriptional regulator